MQDIAASILVIFTASLMVAALIFRMEVVQRTYIATALFTHFVAAFALYAFCRIADDMGADDLKQDVPEHLRGPAVRRRGVDQRPQPYQLRGQ